MEEVFKLIIEKFSFWQVFLFTFVICFLFIIYRFVLKYGAQILDKCDVFTKHLARLENAFLKHEKIDEERHNEIKKQVDDVLEYLTKGDKK